MDEEILTQDEDELEEEMKEIEEEEEREKTKKQPKKKEVQTVQPEVVRETYEAFVQEANLGIANTITGEAISGFDPKRDKALVQLGSIILNKLDKIAIASGV